MSVNFSPYGSSFIRVYLVCIYCFAHFKFISFWPTWRMQIGSAFLQHCVIIKLQIKCVHISWISFRGCRKSLVHFNFFALHLRMCNRLIIIATIVLKAKWSTIKFQWYFSICSEPNYVYYQTNSFEMFQFILQAIELNGFWKEVVHLQYHLPSELH